jgi:hypothetical protein
LHSMLPTIDIPEPMQERVAAFVIGSRLGGGCSTTDCCCCAVPPTTSVSLSFSRCFALEHTHLRVPPAFTAERPKLSSRDRARADAEPFAPLEGRTLRLGGHLRIGLRKPELPLRWSLRLRAIPCTVPCQGFHFPTIGASHHPLLPKICHLPVPRLFCEEKFGQLWSMGDLTSKKSSGVAFQSQE